MRVSPRWSKQVPYRQAQCRCDFLDIDEADVTFAPFDAPDVGPVEIADQCKRLLGQSSLRAQLAHAPTEGCLDSLAWFSDQAAIASP